MKGETRFGKKESGEERDREEEDGKVLERRRQRERATEIRGRHGTLKSQDSCLPEDPR